MTIKKDWTIVGYDSETKLSFIDYFEAESDEEAKSEALLLNPGLTVIGVIDGAIPASDRMHVVISKKAISWTVCGIHIDDDSNKSFCDHVVANSWRDAEALALDGLNIEKFRVLATFKGKHQFIPTIEKPLEHAPQPIRMAM